MNNRNRIYMCFYLVLLQLGYGFAQDTHLNNTKLEININVKKKYLKTLKLLEEKDQFYRDKVDIYYKGNNKLKSVQYYLDSLNMQDSLNQIEYLKLIRKYGFIHYRYLDENASRVDFITQSDLILHFLPSSFMDILKIIEKSIIKGTATKNDYKTVFSNYFIKNTNYCKLNYLVMPIVEMWSDLSRRLIMESLVRYLNHIDYSFVILPINFNKPSAYNNSLKQFYYTLYEKGLKKLPDVELYKKIKDMKYFEYILLNIIKAKHQYLYYFNKEMYQNSRYILILNNNKNNRKLWYSYYE